MLGVRSLTSHLLACDWNLGCLARGGGRKGGECGAGKGGRGNAKETSKGSGKSKERFFGECNYSMKRANRLSFRWKGKTDHYSSSILCDRYNYCCSLTIYTYTGLLAPLLYLYPETS